MIFKIFYISYFSGSPDPWDWQSKTHYPKYTKYEQDLEILKKQPYFLKVNANVTVGVGETAYLPCRVKTLGEFTVLNSDKPCLYDCKTQNLWQNEVMYPKFCIANKLVNQLV